MTSCLLARLGKGSARSTEGQAQLAGEEVAVLTVSGPGAGDSQVRAGRTQQLGC